LEKFKNIIRHLSFTKSETKVILFIVIALIIGFSIKFYKQVLGETEIQKKDYFSDTDKRFLEKSARLNNPDFEKLTYDEKVKILQASEDSLKQAEKEKKSLSKKEQKLEGKQININTAAKDELMQLPGVGEKTALLIMEYRENNSGFKTIEDIMEVKGIGPKKFDKMKKYLKVE
jgi:comEA protein